MKKSVLYALATIALWGSGAVLGKLMSTHNTYFILWLTYLFSVFTYFIFYIKSKAISNIYSWIREIKMKWILIAPLGYFVYWMCYQATYKSYEAYSQTVSEAVVLNYTWPIFTLIFYNIFYSKEIKTSKEKIFEYIAISISFFGIVILATSGQFINVENIEGILLGLSTGASYGLFSAYSRTLGEKQQPLYLLLSILSSLLLMSIVIVVDILQKGRFYDVTLTDIFIAGISGILLESIGYITWTRALSVSLREKVSLSYITSLIYFLPLISITIVSLYFKESKAIEPYFIISFVCVILGSILAQNSSKIIKLLQP